jgi:hypothetical protein
MNRERGHPMPTVQFSLNVTGKFWWSIHRGEITSIEV